MEYTACFPWRIVNLNDLEDLLLKLRKTHLGLYENVEEIYRLNINKKEEVFPRFNALKNIYQENSGKSSLNVKAKRLAFKLKSTNWEIDYDGISGNHSVIFRDLGRRSWARGKFDVFVDFWNEQITIRHNLRKTWRYMAISMAIEFIDIILVFSAIIGYWITSWAWPYLYTGNNLRYLYFGIIALQVTYSFVPAALIEYAVVRIEYRLEENSARERVRSRKITFRRVLSENFSVILRMALIPFAVMTFSMSLFLNIFPNFPHQFLAIFQDATPRQWVIILLIAIISELAASKIRAEALSRRRPVDFKTKKKTLEKIKNKKYI